MLILPKFKPPRPGVEMVVGMPFSTGQRRAFRSDFDEPEWDDPYYVPPQEEVTIGLWGGNYDRIRLLFEVGKAYQPKPGWTRPGWWWFATGDDRLQAVCPDEIGWHWGLTAWEDAKTALYPDGKTDPRNHLRNNGFFPVHVRVLDILGLEAGQWQIKVLVLPINYVYDKPLTEEQW